MASSAFRLLGTRRLGPLCLAEACGAFNNNLVRNGLVVLVFFRLGVGGVGFTAIATALLVAPYILLSATAGQAADRFAKQRVIVVSKAAEALLMTAAAAGFATGSQTILLLVLAGLGAKAAIFDPAKYGLLPEHLSGKELLAGNGLIEAASFVSILLGTVAGGLIVLQDGVRFVASAAIASAAVGLAAALRVPSSSPADPSLRIRANIVAETWHLVREAVSLKIVGLCIVGLSWFWTMGALLLLEFPSITRDLLGGDGRVATSLLTVFAFGVGLGSVSCARLSKGEVSPRYIPFAAAGISIFCWDFASSTLAAGHLANLSAVLSSLAGWRILLDLVLLSACGGAFSVPLYALVQQYSPMNFRGRIIGANSILNSAFMVAGSAMAIALDAAMVSPPRVIEIFAIANVFVAVGTVRLVRIVPKTI